MAKPKDKKAKQKAAQKRARRTREKRKAASAGSSKPPARAPNRFAQNYTRPKDLELIGPLVWAEWSVPDALAKALVADGKPVPAPVTGRMLVDTGANTFIPFKLRIGEKQVTVRCGGTHGHARVKQRKGLPG